jgi:hypothetical protein
VIPLEVVLAILDGVRGEAIEAAEFPQQDYRTEFGFGRVSGILQAVAQVRERLNEKIEEANSDQDQD